MPTDAPEAAQEAVSREVTSEDLAALAKVEAELDQRWAETKIDPSLERIELLMDLLGSPNRAFPAIHVAGTNGKTSTVRMIEALLRAFHRRTGRTTSPHLQLVTERIAIDGLPIHPRDYVRTWEEIKPYVEMVDARSDVAMSKFEVLTAMAYAAFADAPVDVAVVEVGMGGKWDATNVINADVSVITPIGLDHTDYLGDTIEQIAAEKAGIIKSRWDADDLLTPPDNVAIIAEQTPEAMRVVLEQAIAVDASVARAGQEFGVVEATVAVGGQQLTLRGLGGEYTDIFLPLSGAHQAANAAVALAAVEAFFGAGAGRQLDQDTVRAGFAQVSSPGRLERVRTAPTVFIDAAHNPHGAKALGEALERDFEFTKLIGVVGVLGDKDAQGILNALEPHLADIVCTQTSSPRALEAEALAEYARDIFGEERVHVEPYLPSAVELAVELAEDTDVQSGAGVVITGSVVTAGEARTLFGKEPA
ncbi:bifunctional folylpolyglutamate synthase/dihydrofolate synthase [Corynebacterium sp. 153RC1]|uniref:bifunctional tetrahydrofolate synthase/dihydrofolate synthase n=1 Tax=unclassified Corynebacterium TaxID=2624378 RepID=UPI00211CDB2F|nr:MULTISPECIES: folylpolyglutamate synthase/dihydrofolate synthase family protein [unclassified Corynebacterium]MCQ9371100.1 bifunctional folylpolyglutamate synthase/dihydrofolate synthase [Corynebacterium sp. 35RC1]MCQ9353038.1 bifunctional folylpolyglutamate synthase/dihydrofolate synthase [Corynebacterium sp. 209RC1]MCQ9355468.1 bifunctional folylpolyglutamate synthase/dihydrofolate synthase [Corynebacterium sp. 1222RC1]MCQ9357129.1 bifunctional folylpolyglutamate synthase/dihydrofolate syn